MIEYLGPALAIIGSTLSIIGALVNNIQHDHHRAMEIWMFSNIILMIWSTGFYYGIWNGGLSAVALVVMYLTFTVSNFWGLFHVRK